MMNKYIDAEKLKESLKKHYTDITVPVITSEGGLESYFRRSEIKDTIKLIDSLQQEQTVIEKRKQECGCRRLSDNGNYQCERYEGIFGPCDGRCSWIVDYPKLKELKEMNQQEVDLEKEIDSEWKKCNPIDEGMGLESTYMSNEAFDIIARHFYELGLNTRKL